MVVGLGTDILRVQRMAEALERRGGRILERLFTREEREYCRARPHPAQHYAARFAAKEAAMKALGTGWRGGVGWTQIEVVREESGKPTLRLTGRAAERAAELGAGSSLVSLTHDDGYAVAVVILES